MNTEKKLQDILEEAARDLRDDQIVKEFSEALEEFKKMVEDGVATPRGNHQQDIASKTLYALR
jgi:hypothetical protein